MKTWLCFGLLLTGLLGGGCAIRIPLLPLFFLENSPAPEPITPLTNSVPVVASAR